MKIVLFKVLVLYDLLTIHFGNFNEFFPPTFTLCDEQEREGKSKRWKHSLCVSFKNIVFTTTSFCHELPSRSQECHAKIFHIY